MTTKTIAELTAELAEATADVQIGTDDGTHCTPATHDIYERIDGTRYAIRNYSGAISKISAEDAAERTAGRIRHIRHASLASRKARVSAIRSAISAAK